MDLNNNCLIMRGKTSLYKGFYLAILFACMYTDAQAQMPDNQLIQSNGYPVSASQNTGIWPSVPGSSNQTNNSIANPPRSSYGDLSTPQYSPDIFFKGPSALKTNNHILDTGTVITGALQEDLSSKKSKAGDVFSIMLSDNYVVNNEILVPQNSKFIGSVLSTLPAKKTHNGIPGSMQISLQTLVTPDGTSVPVNAEIGYDPNQQRKKDLKKSRGIPIGEWVKSTEYSVYYAVGTVGSRVGVPFLYKGQTHGGKDLVLPKGQFVPVKLSQPLDVTPLIGHNGSGTMTVPSGPPSVPINSSINNPVGDNGQFYSAPGSPPPSNPINTMNYPNNLPNFGGNNMPTGNTYPAGPQPF